MPNGPTQTFIKWIKKTGLIAKGLNFVRDIYQSSVIFLLLYFFLVLFSWHIGTAIYYESINNKNQLTN